MPTKPPKSPLTPPPTAASITLSLENLPPPPVDNAAIEAGIKKILAKFPDIAPAPAAPTAPAQHEGIVHDVEGKGNGIE